MPNIFMQRYPRLMQFKGDGTYPGCVVWMTEADAGYVIQRPNTTGNNNTIGLFDRVTVTATEMQEFSQGVVLRTSADPAIIP